MHYSFRYPMFYLQIFMVHLKLSWRHLPWVKILLVFLFSSPLVSFSLIAVFLLQESCVREFCTLHLMKCFIPQNGWALLIDVISILFQACQNRRNYLFLKFCRPLESIHKRLTIFLAIIPSSQPLSSNMLLILLGRNMRYVVFYFNSCIFWRTVCFF